MLRRGLRLLSPLYVNHGDYLEIYPIMRFPSKDSKVVPGLPFASYLGYRKDALRILGNLHGSDNSA